MISIYTLPDLPYPIHALSPHISKETLTYHHGKHHRAYVSKLNELVKDTSFQGMALEDVVKKSDGALFNNAAQAWNHAFYWKCLSPDRGLAPDDKLANAIERDFGSPSTLVEKFKDCANAKFGSGWTWLVRCSDGTLKIENTDDADTPLRHGRVPLLTCDVWEHAYYLDYKNERTRYVEAFTHLINWPFVSKNYATTSGT